MMRKVILVLTLSLVALMFITTAAMAAKLLCITKETHKGDQSVASCLAKGDEFAIVDDHGIVHILSNREVELTKAFNPQVFEQRAFSIRYRELAPEMKIFGTTVRPAKEKK
ncbi:MAG: succinylglutamate desuccinylase [Desulfobacca sp.]|nr:succinylglutamate desuccinylase [Desulfobacca sp.]